MDGFIKDDCLDINSNLKCKKILIIGYFQYKALKIGYS
jgi:hypothetical protein